MSDNKPSQGGGTGPGPDSGTGTNETSQPAERPPPKPVFPPAKYIREDDNKKSNTR